MKIFQVGLGDWLVASLRKHNIRVVSEAVSNPAELLECLESCACDASVINVRETPWTIDFLPMARANNLTMPVIGVAAAKDRVTWSESRANFLDQGGDDLLAFPVSPRELSSTLRRSLRRSAGLATNLYEFKRGKANIKVDLSAQSVLVNGVAIKLTQYEMMLLQHLVLNQNVLHSDSDLRSKFYPAGNLPQGNIIQSRVSSMRRKMGEVHKDARMFIDTLRKGGGYIIIE